MERVRTNLMSFSTYPYQPELSRHALQVARLSCMYFFFFDIMPTFDNEHNNILYWSGYIGLLVFYNLFRNPGNRRFSETSPRDPIDSNVAVIWCISWLYAAIMFHVLQSQAWSISLATNLFLFLNVFASSILCLFAFHYLYVGLEYIFSCENRNWPDKRTILQYSAAVGIVCCVFLSHCRERPLEQRYLKETVCSSWLAPFELARFLESARLFEHKLIVSKPQIYHKLVCAMRENYGYHRRLDSCEALAGSSNGISLVWSFWATFIVLYIANYVAEMSPELRTKYKTTEQSKPDFLPMAHWYSGTSPDLYRTAFDLIVSVTIFLGRFDMRTQATLNRNQLVPREEETQGEYLYHFREKEELWFDFMADTGDGGNSTYTVAKLLAQPQITIDSDNLKRGDLLLIGGDLAYPNPSDFTYKRRLFHPFQYALQPPSCHERMTVNKPAVPLAMPEPYKVPRCFVIPGNHDWFDGLHTFTRNICHRCWLGGWYMPQKKSYFALKLPMGWWIFGLDLALDDDIDVYQFEFFSKLAEEMAGNNSVIVMTHKPDWLVDWYDNDDSKKNVSDNQSKGKNVSDLICNILKERCKLRIAGDIHHYMRHATDSSQPRRNNNEPIYAQHLLVNGCGGAFTHPTHVFQDFKESHGVSYKCKAAYPTFEESRRLAYRNVWNFQGENHNFNFVGAIIYFMLVFSLFPQCELDHIFQEDSISGFSRSFFGTVWNAFMYLLEHSYVSLGGATLLLIVVVAFVPSKVPCKTRIMIGVLHASIHLASALILMLVFEVSIEFLARQKGVDTSGYNSLCRWNQGMFYRHFPAPNSIQDRIKQWIFGLYSAFIQCFTFAFDVPELIAVTRSDICRNGRESISLWNAIIYYTSIYLYLYLFSAIIASIVFGSYLYICINWLNLHYDEAFSSLQIADYKAFTRFHIKHNGDLEVFTLAVDKVPSEWELDPKWEETNSVELSHLRENPSQWKAAASEPEPLETIKIIDKFVIRREHSPDVASGSATEDPGIDFLGRRKNRRDKKTTLDTEGKTNVDQTVSAKEIQEVEEKQSEVK